MNKWERLGRQRNNAVVASTDQRKILVAYESRRKKKLLQAVESYNAWQKEKLFVQNSKSLVMKVKKILPNDIVRYIYGLCMISNKHDWFKKHKLINAGVFRKMFHSRKINPYNGDITPSIKWALPILANTPCYKEYLRDPGFRKQITIVKLNNIITPYFNFINSKRLITGHYWFSDNCRCYNCDIIKCLAVSYNPKFRHNKKYKKLYKHIWLDTEEKRWHVNVRRWGPDHFQIIED